MSDYRGKDYPDLPPSLAALLRAADETREERYRRGTARLVADIRQWEELHALDRLTQWDLPEE